MQPHKTALRKGKPDPVSVKSAQQKAHRFAMRNFCHPVIYGWPTSSHRLSSDFLFSIAQTALAGKPFYGLCAGSGAGCGAESVPSSGRKIVRNRNRTSGPQKNI